MSDWPVLRFDNRICNLREMMPNGASPANGAIRYTYNAANQLVKVETHNGSSYSKIAEPAYDGEACPERREGATARGW